MNPALIVAGFAVGTLVGLTGVGGGSLMTPLLVYMGLNPLIAVGTDLFYSLPTKVFGWYLHRKQGTIRLDIVKDLCIGGVPAALVGLGVLVAATRLPYLNVVEAWTKHAIGVSVVLSAAMIVASPFILKHRMKLERTPEINRSALIAIGAVVGFIVSTTSIGSGALALPLLLLFIPRVALSEMVGTDIAFAAVLILVSVIGRWKMGHVDVAISLQLMSGSLAGVFVGSRLCGMLAQHWVRPALAVALAVAGLRLI